MSAKAPVLPNSSLYERDFAAWATETARLIREGRFADIDIENLADEIESMARSDKQQIVNRLDLLIQHLLKWAHQPEKRTRSWQLTILNQRTRIERLCQESPSLLRVVRDSIAKVYPDAVAAASIETGLPADAFPQQCPYSAAQILDRGFLPD